MNRTYVKIGMTVYRVGDKTKTPGVVKRVRKKFGFIWVFTVRWGPNDVTRETANNLRKTPEGTKTRFKAGRKKSLTPYASNEWGQMVEAVRADPGNNSIRLGAADWLGENGEERRAEFIRLSVSIHEELAPPKPMLNYTGIRFDRPPIDLRRYNPGPYHGEGGRQRFTREPGWERESRTLTVTTRQLPEANTVYWLRVPLKSMGLASIGSADGHYEFYARVRGHDIDGSRPLEDDVTYMVNMEVVTQQEADPNLEARKAATSKCSRLLYQLSFRAVADLIPTYDRKHWCFASWDRGFAMRAWCRTFDVWQAAGTDLRRREPFVSLTFPRKPSAVLSVPNEEVVVALSESRVVSGGTFQQAMECEWGPGIEYAYKEPPASMLYWPGVWPDVDPETFDLSPPGDEYVPMDTVTVRCRHCSMTCQRVTYDGRTNSFDCPYCGRSN